jgi:manganese/zinc/iron transport system permease protein
VAATHLGRLQREGLVTRTGTDWAFTPAGLAAAHGVVRNHRLWEMFLMYEGQLGVDHIDRDADAIEHWLKPEVVNELEHFLRLHGLEPKLLPIPGEAA